MIEHLFHGTGPVVMAVLWTLVACSAASWGIIFYKLGQLRRARKQSEKFEEVFWESKSLNQIHSQSLEYKQSPVAQVFRAGYQELMRLTRARRQEEGEGEMELGGAANVERALRRAANLEVTRLEGALTFLATTAATAPFIGLFGTVWGIMDAFRGLSTAQSSSIQAVAPGIAEALVATAVGLAAAIPAVVAYNHLSHEVRVLHTDMENFSAEFLNIAERHFLKK
ncbi:MAG: protein TolQ [Alphaproteobacteria bacterium]